MGMKQNDNQNQGVKMTIIANGYDSKTGIFQMGSDFIAVGGYQSKTFKTEKGARKWAAKRGII
jgi:hypothetical protein